MCTNRYLSVYKPSSSLQDGPAPPGRRGPLQPLLAVPMLPSPTILADPTFPLVLHRPSRVCPAALLPERAKMVTNLPLEGLPCCSVLGGLSELSEPRWSQISPSRGAYYTLR